jgi:hypothetical protein
MACRGEATFSLRFAGAVVPDVEAKLDAESGAVAAPAFALDRDRPSRPLADVLVDFAEALPGMLDRDDADRCGAATSGISASSTGVE